jgi:hypothetical protein
VVALESKWQCNGCGSIFSAKLLLPGPQTVLLIFGKKAKCKKKSAFFEFGHL